jgi:hypothetical protein
MEEKELQLVNFEQAKRLKALGFNRETCHLYDGDRLVRADRFFDLSDANIEVYSNWNHEGYDWNDGVQKEWISSPTVALALKWVRDEKKIYNAVSFFDVVTPEYTGRYQVTHIIDAGDKRLKPRHVYETKPSKEYEAAESALLDELLTIIEKEKEQ